MSQMLRKRLGARDGFTLIELVVVVAILGLLAVIVTPKVMGAIENAKNNSQKSSAKQIQVAMERYYAEKGGYPNPVGKCAGYNASTSPTCTLDELQTTLGLGSYVNLDAANLSDTTPIAKYTVTTTAPLTFYLELNFKDGTAVKTYKITPDSIN